jgi:hypothetical protein
MASRIDLQWPVLTPQQMLWDALQSLLPQLYAIAWRATVAPSWASCVLRCPVVWLDTMTLHDHLCPCAIAGSLSKEVLALLHKDVPYLV